MEFPDVEVDSADQRKNTASAAASPHLNNNNNSRREFKDLTLDRSTPDAGPTVMTEDGVVYSEEVLKRNQDEWKQLATAVDRLLFLISFVGSVSLTIIYFVVVKINAVTYDELSDLLLGWANKAWAIEDDEMYNNNSFSMPIQLLDWAKSMGVWEED